MAAVRLFYLLLHSLVTFNATILQYAHPCLLRLHLSPPTVTNAPQRDRSIMDLPSIDDDDLDKNDNDGSIIDVPPIDVDDVGSGKIALPPQLPSSSHAHSMMRWIASS